MSGHTPPDRADLAATASFLRELSAQLSESEPIVLAAPPRRRTRLLVAAAASVVAIVGLAGVVALRGNDNVVRPAVGGGAPADIITPSPATTAGTPVATPAAMAVDTPLVSPSAVVPASSDAVTASTTATTAAATATTPTPTAPSTPLARYEAAVAAWKQCVTARTAAACGPVPDRAAFGVDAPATSTPAAAPDASAGSKPTILLPSPPPVAAGSSACTGRVNLPGLEHPDVLTC